MTMRDYLRHHINTIASIDFEAFDKAHEILISTMKAGANIFIGGNGGSSSTASHFAVDWQKGVSRVLEFYPNVHCLTDNMPLVSAIANDISFEQIFAQQIDFLAKDGDVFLAISGSGNSVNIVRAVEVAKKKNVLTIGLTGFDGGLVGSLVQLNCLIPCHDIKVVEDLHLTFGHALVSKIESEE